MAKLILYRPLHPFSISQGFGQNLNPIYKQWGLLGHNGLDCVRGYVNGKYYETDGAYVRAAHNGTVLNAGIPDSNEGYGVVLKTDEVYESKDGIPAYWKTVYWHMKKDGIFVQPGQKVRAGDILGPADNTGASNGPHLHFGLKPIMPGEADWAWDNVEQDNGYRGAVDPLPYLSPMTAYEYGLTWIQKQLNQIAAILNRLLGK